MKPEIDEPGMPTLEMLCQDTGLTPAQVLAAMAELEDSGMLDKLKRIMAGEDVE